jgi:ELWxxDGT repeat protein
VFEGQDASVHYNLWVTDGTAAGTSELIVPGADSGGLFFGVSSPDFVVLGGKALFEGVDAHGFANLWVTDGSLAGTSELTVTNATADGLFLGVSSPTFTVFGSRAVFAGQDDSGRINLWITDGTSAGTTELVAAQEDPQGLLSFVFPPSGGGPDFTVLGNKVLFEARDPALHLSLWVTDGTAAGTQELTVTNANSLGLFPFHPSPDLTVLGNKALFEGEDNRGRINLWVTDGTSAGTSELTVAGASSGGMFGPYPDFTVFGNRAVFAGFNTNGIANVWVTDGTSAGTSELPIAGGYFLGPLQGISPDFTAFGSKVQFVSLDAGSHPNLAVTDGTAAGTSELAISTANSSGLFAANLPPDFTVLGSRVLFEGYDAFGHIGLWVTDGTAAATSELTVAGANSNGLLNVGGVPDFTVLGADALFVGADASGNENLWVTDGTSAGTRELTVAGPFSLLISSDITVLMTSPTPPPRPDLPWQTDGTSIFLQSDAGPAAIWTVSGTAFVGGGSLPNPGSSWHAKAAGDFFGNGSLDLLLQNDNGGAAIWETNGSGVIGGGSLGNPGASWQVASVGDFNGDGRSDILWQNSSGEIAIWELNGASIIGGGSLGNPGLSWHAVGSGDFNDDKKSDILWQNDSGQVAIWEMNGTTVIGGGNVANPGPSWHALGAGDFNGDGRSDILLQNDSGQVAIWEMNGTSLIGGGNVANPGASWHVMGVGDYNSDGKSDILLQSSSGDVAIWEMNGTSIIGGGTIANPGPTWHI